LTHKSYPRVLVPHDLQHTMAPSVAESTGEARHRAVIASASHKPPFPPRLAVLVLVTTLHGC
jgi:hypothetical protein